MSIIKKRDPSKQLYYTRNDVDRGIKVEVTLKVLMKKKKIDEGGEVSFIFNQPYFNCKIFTINNKYEIIKADEEINKGIATWLSEGSGLVVEKVLHHYVSIV